MKNILIITGGNLNTGFAATYISDQIEKKSSQSDQMINEGGQSDKLYVIAADHGMDHCKSLGITPDEIYGDFDSAETDALSYYEEQGVLIHRFPAEKDETDTELAVLRALELFAENQTVHDSAVANVPAKVLDGSLTILGATGTRLDHVLGNIQMLKLTLDRGVDCYLVDAHNRIRMINSECRLRKADQFGNYVSLLPFTPSVKGITLKGFAYDVEDFELQAGIARGVSNQIVEEEAVISLDEGCLLVIESRD